MKILIDVMSGDNAPLELIKGAVAAARDFPAAQLVLVGREDVIKQVAAEQGLSLDKVSIAHADGIITMEDAPMSVVRAKKDCSMAVALKMLAAGEGDAVVSAGNTGALLTGATLLVFVNLP